MDNFNDIFDQFVNRIGEIINKHAPLRRLSRNSRNWQENLGLQRAYLHRFVTKIQSFGSHFMDGNSNEKQYFRRYTNILTKLKNRSKKLYFMVSLKKAKRIGT